MELRFWAATDTGKVRDHNEDNFLVDQNLQLFVVCDGMGGHAAGEVASAVCVRTVREVVAAEQALINRLSNDPEDRVAMERLKQLLRRAVETANARIFQMSSDDSSRRGMGTTCVAQLIVGKRLFVGHVGDSRIYRLRGEEIEQITDDHSLLNEMIRQGQVAPDMTEAEFPHNNAVTRAVGVRETVEVDAFFVEVEEGDRYLMCSDGLSEYLEGSSERQPLMAVGDPEETTKRCIDYANDSGGKDNITVVVLDCERDEVTEEKGAGPEKSEVIEILRKTAYFHYLEGPELERVRQMAERLELEDDEDVIADGEDNHRLFLILKGSVSLQLDGEQVSVLTTGEHFGEMALIDAQDEQDENMVARTLEPSIFLAIGRHRFLGLIRGEPNLAIKLLWNFVQVFADRLQSVPPEFRFTPDEWRSDPEAIADVTPPSGTLVFEEDLDRNDKKKEGKGDEEAAVEVAQTPSLPELPPLGEVRPGLGEATAPGGGSLEEEISQPGGSVEDRETLSLDSVNREDVALPSSEVDKEAPAVQINASSSPEEVGGGPDEKPKLEVRDGGDDHGFKRDEPTAQIDKPDFDAEEQAEPSGEAEASGGRAARSELSQTVEINWDDAPPEKREQLRNGPPPPPAKEKEEQEEALRETVSMEADVDEFRRIRDQNPSKPTPSASILKKAAKKEDSEASEDKETSEQEGAKEGKRVAISGQAQVAEEKEEAPEEEEPKIMISSDLMAEGED